MRAGGAGIAGVLLAVGLMVGVGAEQGSAADALKVGVVDPQRVLEQSKAGRRALDELKDYRDRREKLLLSDEEELRNLEKSLKDDSGLGDAQKRDKQGQFRTKMQDYQRRVQEFNRELTGKQKEMVDEYMKKIAASTKTVAEKNGVTLVVDKGSESTIKIILYHKDGLDITDQVIKEFDRQNK